MVAPKFARSFYMEKYFNASQTETSQGVDYD
jgi:hypothetical protein